MPAKSTDVLPAKIVATSDAPTYRVHLRRLLSRSLVVPVQANNKPFLFLLDTGASQSAFDSNRLHPATFGGKVEVLIYGATVANRKTPVEWARLRTLQVGERKTSNFLISFVDLAFVNRSYRYYGDPPIDGILGQDFLLQHRAVIDVGNNELRFYDP